MMLALSICGISSATASVEDRLKEFLKENYPWTDIEVRELTLNAEPPDQDPWKIMVERGLPGKTVFSLEFGNGKRITATADVRVFDTVVLGRRAFRKGYVMGKDDLYVTLMEVGRIPKGAVRDPESVINRPLARSIIANAPIVDTMIGSRQQVRRGQRVLLVAGAEGFNITTLGEMRESASVGNYVKVVNTASKKTVTGLLIDENTVRVEF